MFSGGLPKRKHLPHRNRQRSQPSRYESGISNKPFFCCLSWYQRPSRCSFPMAHASTRRPTAMALTQPGSATGGAASVSRRLLSSSSAWPPPRPKRQQRNCPSIVPPKTTLPRRTARRAEIQVLLPREVEVSGFFEAWDQRKRFPSCEPDRKRSWSATVTASTDWECLLNIKWLSLSTFHKRTVLSTPPVRGLFLLYKSREATPETWPNKVSTHLFVRKSQTLRDLSKETVYN
mmetsp:Transcript_102161/g.256055  ORF Transcript_102161/g.256055 Transcript_102161/m.256055 type:complete len:233 (+) Transcript_102161:8-706(+)